jgi:hypothetical protein
MNRTIGEWTIMVVPYLIIIGVVVWHWYSRELSDDEIAADIDEIFTRTD